VTVNGVPGCTALWIDAEEIPSGEINCSGGIHGRWFFAQTLNDMGVAAFVLDSFGPSGVTKVFERKRSVGEWEQAIDALTAIEVLQSSKRIDFSRLGAMGRSLGGQTAVRLALQASENSCPRRALC